MVQSFHCACRWGFCQVGYPNSASLLGISSDPQIQDRNTQYFSDIIQRVYGNVTIGIVNISCAVLYDKSANLYILDISSTSKT